MKILHGVPLTYLCVFIIRLRGCNHRVLVKCNPEKKDSLKFGKVNFVDPTPGFYMVRRGNIYDSLLDIFMFIFNLIVVFFMLMRVTFTRSND